MNYRKTYMKIIKKAKSENRKKYKKSDKRYVYYESHHILPKSLFPLWGDRYYERNLVLLTPREHYFCHQLLDKIYPNSNMFIALWQLANDGQNNYCKKGSKEYEKLRIKFSNLMSEKSKGNKHGFNKDSWKLVTKEGIERRTLKLKGQKRTEKQKKYISEKTKEAMKKIPREKLATGLRGKPAWNKGLKSNKTKFWWTNGVINTQSETCPDGFWKGYSGTQKGKAVMCIETGEIFKGVTTAQQKYGKGKIGEVCNGKRKTACGLHWKWVKF